MNYDLLREVKDTLSDVEEDIYNMQLDKNLTPEQQIFLEGKAGIILACIHDIRDRILPEEMAQEIQDLNTAWQPFKKTLKKQLETQDFCVPLVRPCMSDWMARENKNPLSSQRAGDDEMIRSS